MDILNIPIAFFSNKLFSGVGILLLNFTKFRLCSKFNIEAYLQECLRFHAVERKFLADGVISEK